MLLKGFKKAFTLSEIFISMIILSILVAVSIHAFNSNRKDYSREYMYYTAYQTIVKVVDNALMNDDYLNTTTPEGVDFEARDGYTKMIVNDVACGYETKPLKCHAFTPAANFCNIFAAYVNGVDSCSESPKKVTLNNGMEFIFDTSSGFPDFSDGPTYLLSTHAGGGTSGGAASVLDLPILLALGPESGTPYEPTDPVDPDPDPGTGNGTEVPYTPTESPTTGLMTQTSGNSPKIYNTEVMKVVIKVDIDGSDKGENVNNYDIVKFMVTLSGKVIPLYGPVNGIRDYIQNGDGICTTGASGCDAGGNNALMAFDVVYTDPQTNLLTVLNEGRSVSFPEAACMAGYIDDRTNYCHTYKYNSLTGEARSNGVGLAPECDPSDDDYIMGGDCYIRLVQKMKWSK